MRRENKKKKRWRRRHRLRVGYYTRVRQEKQWFILEERSYVNESQTIMNGRRDRRGGIACI